MKGYTIRDASRIQKPDRNELAAVNSAAYILAGGDPA
jgi:hypothetical protein